ncbi:hypothetical protein [Pseudonocardia sp. ICBG601]|uniref:hypothetical protein n=1 Tax=Pseudonocardia sp. ICBG601 TaxID=2846759 RepID=UPI001CF6F729|nr:hypothetical protein [Pseudonocardia sp. ICBG601]
MDRRTRSVVGQASHHRRRRPGRSAHPGRAAVGDLRPDPRLPTRPTFASTNPAPSTTSHIPPIGDKGYIGRGILTPFKKQPGRETLDWQKTFNKSLNAHARTIERVICPYQVVEKVLHTDYRATHATFKTTISAVIGLIFYALT